MADEKTSKKQLLKEIDEKLNSLNLLRAALDAEKSVKQADLQDYKRRFYELVYLKNRR